MKRAGAVWMVSMCFVASAEANPVVWFGTSNYSTGSYGYTSLPGQTLAVSMYVVNDPSTNDDSYL